MATKKINTKEFEKRREELERKSFTAKVEAECLKLSKNQNIVYEILDMQSYQRIKMRLSRLKKECGLEFTVEIDKNNFIVTRK